MENKSILAGEELENVSTSVANACDMDLIKRIEKNAQNLSVEEVAGLILLKERASEVEAEERETQATLVPGQCYSLAKEIAILGQSGYLNEQEDPLWSQRMRGPGHDRGWRVSGNIWVGGDGAIYKLRETKMDMPLCVIGAAGIVAPQALSLVDHFSSIPWFSSELLYVCYGVSVVCVAILVRLDGLVSASDPADLALTERILSYLGELKARALKNVKGAQEIVARSNKRLAGSTE